MGLHNIRSGVRELVIDISERQKDSLPHRLTISGHAALLTFRGRPPLCLKCGGVGHVRGRCPHRRVEPVPDKTQPSPSTPLTAAQRVLRSTVSRQRGELVPSDSDADLDLNAIAIESQIPDIAATPEFFTGPAPSINIDFGYGEVQSPVTPEPIGMDIVSPARKAEDDDKIGGTSAKRIRTYPCPHIETVFPKATIPFPTVTKS